MKFPKGKGFDLAGGLVITVVLEDVILTGTFLGEIEERHHDEPIICPPAVVNVDLDPEFILLQLVCDVRIDGREFEEGTIVAVNVEQIQFIAAGGECQKKQCDGKK
jgi:hypothetical protein